MRITLRHGHPIDHAAATVDVLLDMLYTLRKHNIPHVIHLSPGNDYWLPDLTTDLPRNEPGAILPMHSCCIMRYPDAARKHYELRATTVVEQHTAIVLERIHDAHIIMLSSWEPVTIVDFAPIPLDTVR